MPGSLDDDEFLHAYLAHALRKPQVVADNVLTGIFLTDANYRGPLTALLVQEAVEAAQKLDDNGRIPVADTYRNRSNRDESGS